MSGYTVIDFETTGVMPERHDRVVEIGVVQVSDDGVIEDEWTTLVNPSRDVGASHIHGLSARELLGAPSFADVADHLLSTIVDRTVVAHNASFDMRFLHYELDRAGYPIATRPDALCSMKWAGRLIGPAKLQHCCEALDIPFGDAHQALADAQATAMLLGYLMRHGAVYEEWHDDVQRSRRFGWPAPVLPGVPPRISHRSSEPVAPDSWMQAVLSSTWIAGAPENEAAYMLALDAALLDRYISVNEGADLVEIARQSGLGRDRVIELHSRYLLDVAKIALEDQVVSDEERSELEVIASALGLSVEEVDRSLEAAAGEDQDAAEHADGHATFLVAGDRVVFTGEMRRDRSNWIELIVEAGLVSGGVTKTTRLLVSADPDSMSGKAGKARKFGVPVVDENAFERLFAEYCASCA